MATIEEVSGEILHLIYDVIRSIEKDSHDPTQKRDSYDSAAKIQELRGKLQLCRDMINKLPGIELTREEQLRRVDALRRQLVRKRELLVKYKSMCHFDTPDIKDHYHCFFRDRPAYRQTVASSCGAGLNPDVPSSPGTEQLVSAVLSCGKKDKHALEQECLASLVDKLAPEVAIRVMDAWANPRLPQWGPGVFGTGQQLLCGRQETWPHRLGQGRHLLHLLYLSALWKRPVPGVFESAVKRRLPELRNGGDFKELAVLCSSLFKLKIKVSNDAFLDAVARCTARALTSGEDRFDVIAVLKFLRLCEYRSVELLEGLACYVSTHAREMAVFASVADYDSRAFGCLEDRVYSLLNALHPGEPSSRLHPSLMPRLKDVSKVLWAFAAVSHSPKKETLQSTAQFLEQRFVSEADLYYVLDSLQSLICLNYFPWDLIDKATSAKAQHWASSERRTKAAQRFHFVKASAQLTRGVPVEWAGRETMPLPQRRDGFSDLVAVFAVQGLSPSCLLPHIRIAAVTFAVCPRSLTVSPLLSLADLHRVSADLEKPRLVSVELLDPGVKVHGGMRLTGCHGCQGAATALCGLLLLVVVPGGSGGMRLCGLVLKGTHIQVT
ncbi:hypothetical protein HPB48_017477 [Haemaphysalis longicornis]|uniref:Mediator of RNA polymerase II transcription subunit 9 n=1 Tax=Haemaphysalis longicornis TaxID=44386 RepID=A0A9J6FSR1_HAELO|nr:hypothetical protein HPB48_017477 [Haemaphysalis longicornis]